ncbi:MAG: DUF2813 domain-containing protein [Candidatus Omnitrophota bacterium]|jgi:AAA15 family ATPase/GTPase|nr:MAG: DUF2813 domain-containing protein [Candidatus Omnitrophota bacterium]
MITLIEALNFRCFKYIRQPLGPFQVLVGPNASGKSAFFDILKFLHYLVKEDLEAACKQWSEDFIDLFWGRDGEEFEVAIEASISGDNGIKSFQYYDSIRYELRIKHDSDIRAFVIDAESLYLKTKNDLMMDGKLPLEIKKLKINSPYLIRYSEEYGIKIYTIEMNPSKYDSLSFGPNEKWSKLSGLQFIQFTKEMDAEFIALKNLLVDNIEYINLDSEKLKKTCSYQSGKNLRSNGENLSWVVENFSKNHKDQFNEWLLHVQTALPDLENIRAVVRPEDRKCYLMLKYRNGLEVPSWMVSEGTLRLLALTIIAYLPGAKGIYLIEEPENGIHPLNIETIMQSLQSIYDGQVLITTHSPAIISLVDVDQILCFNRNEENGAKIICGNDHPVLKDWKKESNLGVLFAGGFLE